MEILVLSDSHGRVDHMVRAVEQFHPRQVLHLGDCVRDAQALERHAAREYGADVLLFGHTHVPLVDYDGTLWVMNPGAAGDYTRPTCGLLTIREGVVTCSVQSISLGR